MAYHMYSVKEAVVRPLLTDDPSSTTGPTYGDYVPVTGIQKIGTNMNVDQQKLPGEDTILAIEGSLEEMAVTLEYGKLNPEALAVMAGAAYWAESTGEKVAIHEDSGSSYVQLKVRCTKIGSTGQDVVLDFPKIKCAGLQRDLGQRAFGTNQTNASAALTESTQEVIIDGTPTYKRVIYIENRRDTAAALYSVGTVAPTFTSVPTSGAGSVAVGSSVVLTWSKELAGNTVNKYTCRIKKTSDSSLVTATVTLVNNGASTTVTIDPASNLAAATGYTVDLSSKIKAADGASYAGTTFTFTTA